jgi:hypothetical protein
MRPDQQRQGLVVLNVAPSLEGHVADWLVSRPEGSGFTSLQVSGYGADPGELSIAEQVAGRQRRIQFEVQMPLAVVDQFLEDASAALGNTAIRYWVLPLLAAGHLGDEPRAELP